MNPNVLPPRYPVPEPLAVARLLHRPSHDPDNLVLIGKAADRRAANRAREFLTVPVIVFGGSRA